MSLVNTLFFIVSDLASQQLQGQISPMVLVAKSVALNMDSAPAVAEWRTQNNAAGVNDAGGK